MTRPFVALLATLTLFLSLAQATPESIFIPVHGVEVGVMFDSYGYFSLFVTEEAMKSKRALMDEFKGNPEKYFAAALDFILKNEGIGSREVTWAGKIWRAFPKEGHGFIIQSVEGVRLELR